MPSGPLTLSLSGQSFDIAISVGRVSRAHRSLQAGSDTEFKVAILGMAKAAISFGCSGAPAGTDCSVQETDGEDGSTNVSLSLTPRRNRLVRHISPGDYSVNLDVKVGDSVISRPVTVTVPDTRRAARLALR
jgi:hypothetical protein